jgi:hypothetical protein
MKKIVVIILVGAGLCALGAAFAQIKPEDITEDKKWEEFLTTAVIAGSEQILSREAVTKPYKLTLEKDGVKRFALWKDIDKVEVGRPDRWRYEIAAFRIDRLLGLNMVAPTVERRFEERRGSLQLWLDHKMAYQAMNEDRKLKAPGGLKAVLFNRAIYLHRAFDNLIANEDRHANNILITDDWRLYLIDHSRSFRTSKKFTDSLIYTEKHKEGPKLMLGLPRAFLEKLKALTAETIRETVGEYLTEEEIQAVMKRRDLVLVEIDRLIKKNGEAETLY